MKRFLTQNTSSKGKNNILNYALKRSFATGPQKNPYDSVKTQITVGNQKYSLYKIPALQDKRICKYL